MLLPTYSYKGVPGVDTYYSKLSRNIEYVPNVPVRSLELVKDTWLNFISTDRVTKISIGTVFETTSCI